MLQSWTLEHINNYDVHKTSQSKLTKFYAKTLNDYLKTLNENIEELSDHVYRNFWQIVTKIMNISSHDSWNKNFEPFNSQP